MTVPQTDSPTDAELARALDGDFSSNHAEVNGVRLHYVEGGTGEPLLLLGGWPQTWWQWHKVMPALARRYRVIAVDLRGMGGSTKPEAGYDKKTMAHDIHELIKHLGLTTATLAGHDIGAMVATAHAAIYPEATTKLVILDVPHPDETWADMRLLPELDQEVDGTPTPGRYYLWWFAFNQVRGLPEQLLAGRSRILADWLFDRLAKDPASLDERSRQIYAHAYSTADAVRAGNSWYQAFPTDIVDEQSYPKLSLPILALGGAQANYPMLAAVMPSKGTDVRLVEIADCGHYLPDEQPEAVVDALTDFLG
ncbi:alpha/beta fold hydrolase [Actinoalloteichus hymeniacidonis]|uniref:Hydrolase or acyltransferase of alpha/beta superfamily n=1 Tax=Actinoalloteichus hymeniacidonis TaxID=340345 RepID=A0AAC9HLW5_9PSEU|nr:alpha/beta hydrolase [Actinoalloteichus hymeniacidonis]AOS61518.1 putative hydrolase or acyltransferase of alpha/beta superfamily [Actinoalloteichus hymeniacidonis]MBB5910474.1 pimeloyl-ACP methyl ester carboxylesterase [Actinoalloteichus hymeniacidonis]